MKGNNFSTKLLLLFQFSTYFNIYPYSYNADIYFFGVVPYFFLNAAIK